MINDKRRYLKIILKVLFAILLLSGIGAFFVFNYLTGYIPNQLFNIECSDSINYHDETYLISSTYTEMNSFFESKPHYETINLEPNNTNIPDYAPPIAYYYADENKFWIIQDPGFGRQEDTRYYGPFSGKPCVDYSRK
jgi:hypothetical protein